MCGFAVLLALQGRPVDPAIIERMTAVIEHRGPDAAGSYSSEAVAMGFRRLSILDLSPLGHQPMVTADEQVILVFNGEIYNYVELRQELETLGHTFKSSGDTEVLLQAYCAWGAACLDKLNGMWAFVIYDRRRNLLFGARDRFGIKPLYHYHTPNHVLLTSEIKSIRASGLYQGGPNWPIIASFLTAGQLDHTQESFYTGIDQVPPGCAFELNLGDGRYREWRYWSVEELAQTPVADPAGAFAELFEDSVRLHMRSDVPVGVHLSGGLDSTSIICASARIRATAKATQPLLAFSYIAPEFDETHYIQDTIQQTQAHLVRLQTRPDLLWSKLEQMLWFQDEPVHSMTALIGYELMQLAADNQIKVILNGQGSDEVIGGYPSYFKHYWYTLLKHSGLRKTWNEISEHTRIHGGDRWVLLGSQLRHAVQVRLNQAGAYRTLAYWWHRQHHQTHPWFTGQLTRQYPPEPVENPADLDAALTKSIYHDPLPLYLRVEDRNSMAHSIEVRLPFLDYRLVSLLFSLPADWKMRGSWNKFVLREAMRGRIPESVRTRADKMGFPVPAKQWIAGLLYEPVQDILNSRQARERGIYNIGNIQKDLERHRQGDINIAASLFRIIQFEVSAQLKDKP